MVSTKADDRMPTEHCRSMDIGSPSTDRPARSLGVARRHRNVPANRAMLNTNPVVVGRTLGAPHTTASSSRKGSMAADGTCPARLIGSRSWMCSAR